MSTVKERLMTAEEFLHFSGSPNVKVELVRGEVVTMCRPGFRHGLRQGRAFSILDNYGRTTRRGRAVVETGVVTEKDPDTVRGPDVSFWSAEQVPLDQEPEGYPEGFADLCVEVLSPNNAFAKILKKMGEYFKSGTRMVWIIDPEDRTVTVYRSLDEGQVLHESATLTCEDVLPGFSCPVREFFN
jgi:Uma2 family endonuclease